jgi:hypothetical protein
MSKLNKLPASLTMLPLLLEMLKKFQTIAKSCLPNHLSSLKLYQPVLMFSNAQMKLLEQSTLSQLSSLKINLFMATLLIKLILVSNLSMKLWMLLALNVD